MTTERKVALALMQLVALSIPPVAVPIQQLRQFENLPWLTPKVSFGLAIIGVVSFIETGSMVVASFTRTAELPNRIRAGLALTIVGLVPFALFTHVLEQERRVAFGS